MKKTNLFIALLAAMVLLLAACGSNEGASTEPAKKESTETPAAEDQAEETASGEGPTYPMTVAPTVASVEGEEALINFDDVEFEKMPEKIAVFDYGFLDTLDALGVEGIEGVAQDSSLPAHLEKYASDEYTNVGGLKEPLLEDLAEMAPDVIFISGRQSAFYEELKEIAPVVFIGTSDNDYWNTFLSSVDLAAKMFGKEEEAEEYVGKIDSALEEIKALAGNYETSLVTMYNEGKLSGFAKESRYGYIYDVYGFNPATDDIESTSHGSNFGFEAILEINPQVLFVIDRTAAVGGDSKIETDMENDIIKKTDAYTNEKIVYLDGPLWYLGGGGLQAELAKIEEVLAELK
ncbi:siderophore ABC transporter substrate-binding protein [Metabacillus schmidteae]|uniref:siderophore ABC transporter substrate-binding protein n=1 Tax=Metabacillus schmidteae TaxID=2730405 RepID=UPI00158ADA2F|nr:siderophore ABC transporter substrate-binding protein [Metabacillus schmidteae]